MDVFRQMVKESDHHAYFSRCANTSDFGEYLAYPGKISPSLKKYLSVELVIRNYPLDRLNQCLGCLETGLFDYCGTKPINETEWPLG